MRSDALGAVFAPYQRAEPALSVLGGQADKSTGRALSLEFLRSKLFPPVKSASKACCSGIDDHRGTDEIVHVTDHLPLLEVEGGFDLIVQARLASEEELKTPIRQSLRRRQNRRLVGLKERASNPPRPRGVRPT